MRSATVRTADPATAMGWHEAAIELDDAALQALRTHWAWLIGERWRVVAASAIGDVFLELPAGSVWWLSTSTGDLAQAADSAAAFRAALDGPDADEWFLPGLAAAARAHGLTLGPGECYGYGLLPVFAEGRYAVENLRPMPAAAHLREAGALLRAIRALPDGTCVELRVGDDGLDAAPRQS